MRISGLFISVTEPDLLGTQEDESWLPGRIWELLQSVIVCVIYLPLVPVKGPLWYGMVWLARNARARNENLASVSLD
jgi:hypothetical protein